MFQIDINPRPYLLPFCINRCHGPRWGEVLDPRHKVSSGTSGFFSSDLLSKAQTLVAGGKARSRFSLETFYMCLTKVICKQKRNPIENGRAHRSTAPCFSVPRARLITFKQHFQTAFWEPCQRFSLLGKIFKTIWFCRLYFFDFSLK